MLDCAIERLVMGDDMIVVDVVGRVEIMILAKTTLQCAEVDAASAILNGESCEASWTMTTSSTTTAKVKLHRVNSCRAHLHAHTKACTGVHRCTHTHTIAHARSDCANMSGSQFKGIEY